MDICPKCKSKIEEHSYRWVGYDDKQLYLVYCDNCVWQGFAYMTISDDFIIEITRGKYRHPTRPSFVRVSRREENALTC